MGGGGIRRGLAAAAAALAMLVVPVGTGLPGAAPVPGGPMVATTGGASAAAALVGVAFLPIAHAGALPACADAPPISRGWLSPGAGAAGSARRVAATGHRDRVAATPARPHATRPGHRAGKAGAAAPRPAPQATAPDAEPEPRVAATLHLCHGERRAPTASRLVRA